MKAIKPKDAGQLKLRLPIPLKEWLHERAIESRRSLSAEIAVRLQISRERQQPHEGKAA